ncbi:MAG TPA: DUF1844 domain-containing protein [candidate division Zixibacteria bacterium]|nr:DUF1844 domain-containing protein [candidate division Zixibacteria bacterium]
MSADVPEMDPHFMQMVISLQAGAMQQLGKVANPFTGKVERNLPMAQATIDLLGMLEKKTSGNLTDTENKLLQHALYELRMNFVDESKKSDTDESESEENKAEASPEEESQAGQTTSD